jgi:hypothetical protein
MHRGNCQIWHTKGLGKSVRLYRMSEYSGFILVNRNTLGPSIFVGCQRISDNSGVNFFNTSVLYTVELVQSNTWVVRYPPYFLLVFSYRCNHNLCKLCKSILLHLLDDIDIGLELDSYCCLYSIMRTHLSLSSDFSDIILRLKMYILYVFTKIFCTSSIKPDTRKKNKCVWKIYILRRKWYQKSLSLMTNVSTSRNTDNNMTVYKTLVLKK